MPPPSGALSFDAITLVSYSLPFPSSGSLARGLFSKEVLYDSPCILSENTVTHTLLTPSL